MMTSATIHVVVAFTAAGDEVVAEPPQQAPSASAAISRAKALLARHIGVIAWSRTADPTTGDYGDPVELVRLGEIPDWFDEMGVRGDSGSVFHLKWQECQDFLAPRPHFRALLFHEAHFN